MTLPRIAHVVARSCVLLLALAVPVVFDPTRDEVFAPVKIDLMHALLGVGLVATAAGLLFGGPRPGLRLLPVVDLAVAGYAVLNVLAYLHSLDRAVSLAGEFPEYQGLTTVLGYLAAYTLVRVGGWSTRAHAALFGVLTTVTGLVGGYAVLQRAGLDPLWGFAPRPFAGVGQPNSMAALLVVCLPAAVAVTVRYHGIRRVVAMLAAALGTAGLMVSQSRGAWLAVGVAGLFTLLRLDRAHRRTAVLAAGGLALFVSLALLLTPKGHNLVTHIGKRITAVAETGSGSTGQHLTLNRIGLLITADQPWLGIGQDVFPQVAQGYADAHLSPAQAELLRPYRAESPHDELLGISSSAGIPALLAYLVAVGAAGRRMLRLGQGPGTWPRIAGAAGLAVLVGHLVNGLFLTAEVSSSLLFWLVLAATISLPAPAPAPAPPLPLPPPPQPHPHPCRE